MVTSDNPKSWVSIKFQMTFQEIIFYPSSSKSKKDAEIAVKELNGVDEGLRILFSSNTV